MDSCQRRLGQVDAPPARDHCRDVGWAGSRGGERRGRTGARTEQADAQLAQLCIAAQLIDHARQALAEQGDVEAQLAGDLVDGLLVLGQQVEQQGGQAHFVEAARHALVAWAVPAAAAAVHEDHQSTRRSRHAQVAVQAGLAEGEAHRGRG